MLYFCSTSLVGENVLLRLAYILLKSILHCILPKGYLTNEQRVLLSNFKMLTAVRNGDFTLPYSSSSEIDCLITDTSTL